MAPQLDIAADKVLRTLDVADLARVPGCYSVVLVHADGVVVLTDPVGQFPLFTARGEDGLLIASRASALGAATDDSVDPTVLAARVACPDVMDMFGTGTVFRRVRRIAPGTMVTVDSRGIREKPKGRIGVDSSIGLSDAADCLRACLVDSVRARKEMATSLSSDFSGGLDSTSLAFLATDDDKSVHCLTSGSSESVASNEDIERAFGYARLSSALSHRMVPGPDSLPFTTLVAAEDEPHPAPLYGGPLRSRLVVAGELGADIHLVGEGGDVLFSAPPVYLADLARKGDLATLWRHCVAWARLRTRSPLALFRRAVAVGTTSRNLALRRLADRIHLGRPVEATSWEDNWICHWPRPRADWLTARARQRLASDLADLAGDIPECGRGDAMTNSWLYQQTLTQQAVRHAGDELGIAVHAPFLDSAVVRACLSVSAHRRVDPDVPKPLLRAALAGLVPEVVLSRPTKGDYVRDAYRGARAAAPRLRQLLTDSAAADHGLIEPGPIRRVLDDAIQGLPTPWGALNQVFAVELWLRETSRRFATA